MRGCVDNAYSMSSRWRIVHNPLKRVIDIKARCRGRMIVGSPKDELGRPLFNWNLVNISSHNPQKNDVPAHPSPQFPAHSQQPPRQPRL